MKKYLVTGGAGFIGSHIVDRLVKDGHEVIVVDNFCSGKEENLNSKAKVFNLDISDHANKEKITSLMSDCAGVFHLAALARVQPSIENPVGFNKANVDGTLNILICAKDAGVKRVVYSASSSAYGNASIFPTPEDHPTDPLSPYGLQKLIGEQYCRVFHHCYGLETVSLRYFNVYGERQPLSGAYCLVMGIFCNQRINNQPLTIVGDGEQRRDFTYVGDVSNANILAMNSENVGFGESINIGNGDNRSVNDIADLIGGEKIYLEKRLEPQKTLADNSKAKKLLNWEPTTSIEDWIPKYKKELGI
jgi:UDP-glucose 4-epimerase